MTMRDPMAPSPADGLYDQNDPALTASWRQSTAERAERADRARDVSVAAKLADAATPGAGVTFDPDEAERAGAFREDAMSPEDAAAAEDGPHDDEGWRPLPPPANDHEQER